MMKKTLIILLVCALTGHAVAQKSTGKKTSTATTAQKTKSTTTAKTTAKPAAKTQTAGKKTSAKTGTKAQATGKKTTAKTATGKNGHNTTYDNASIRSLRNERASVQKKIKQQQEALNRNKADVAKRLQNLMVINSEIGEKQKNINNIQQDIDHLNGNIDILQAQLQTLELQLKDRRQKYIKSMRYMARHRTVQDKLMFVFSAKNLAQMFRRMRFVREYASYQRVQGERVKAKQAQVNEKQRQLQEVKSQKHTLLTKNQEARTQLEGKQTEQQQVVQGLQKQQKTIQGIIDQHKQKEAAMNAQIDRLIAIEVERARARAAAEAQRKAAAAEAAKRRAAELARRKAAAEAAARENERRIAAAKAAEEKARAEAQAAAEAAERARQSRLAKEAQRQAAERQAAADQRAREARAQREAAERKARAEEERAKREMATAERHAEEASQLSTADRALTGGFTANKGRLPMPVTGSCRIVGHYGTHTVEGLSTVTLENKGINIKVTPGAAACSIYDGQVVQVMGYQGTWVVIVSHGGYMSVYCNLRSVSVTKGQKVSTRQRIGYVANDGILQLQLLHGSTRVNPEPWLRR